MNSTMLSQIVWVMFLVHHSLPKVAKNCQKNIIVDFLENYYAGSDDTGSDNTGTVEGRQLVLNSKWVGQLGRFTSSVILVFIKEVI